MYSDRIQWAHVAVTPHSLGPFEQHAQYKGVHPVLGGVACEGNVGSGFRLPGRRAWLQWQ